MNGEPIKKISFINTNEGGEYVAAADSHALKIYDRQNVKMFTTIEPGDPINDFCIFPNSGLILFANDSPHSGIFFVPVYFFIILVFRASSEMVFVFG